MAKVAPEAGAEPDLEQRPSVTRGVSTRIQRVQTSQVQQIKALLKKNWRIHSRTRIPCLGQCPCGPGEACPCPCVVFSACMLQFMCPIIFVFFVTAVPFIIVKAAMSKKDADKFLEVQDVKPIFPKPYPGWPSGYWDYGDDKARQTFYGIHPDDPITTGVPPQIDEAGWDRRPPVGITPILDTLFKNPLVSWGGHEAPNQYSCHCKTLGLIGPAATVNNFKTFLNTEYTAWKSRVNITNWQVSQSTQNFQVGWQLLHSVSRRLSGNGHGANFTITNTSVDEDSYDDAESEFDSNVPLRKLADHLLDGLDRLSGQNIKDRVFDGVERLSGRRLQKRRSNDDIREDSLSWANCIVDQGGNHDRPIWRTFGSEKDIENWLDDSNYGDYSRTRSETSSLDRLCGVIEFKNDVQRSGTPEYTIRMNVTGNSGMDMHGVDGDLTKEHVRPDNSNRWRGAAFWYRNSGFLAIQHLMHKFIADSPDYQSGPKTLLAGEPHFIDMPVGGTTKWMFGDVMAGVLGMPLTQSLQFGPMVASLAFYVARERSTRQRELMRMMGLSDASLIWSWIFLIVFLNLLITMVCMILFMAFGLKHSDWFLWWVLLWFFSNAISVFGMSMAAFFSSEKWASLSALGMFFGSSWTVTAAGSYSPVWQKVLLSVFPSNAFNFGASSYFQLEWWKIGCKWSNSGTIVQNYSYSIGVSMLMVNFVLWVGIFYYFDQIIPWHNVGVARKPWFCCTGEYWREFLGKPPLVGEAVMIEDGGNTSTRPEFVEKEEDAHLVSLVRNNQCVIVNNLTKHFANAQGVKFTAVDGLSMKMYQDECFCLLGHNGAGKTTTMMMLTGCIPQSSGKIKVSGFDIPEQVRIIRSSMGFCPQQNCLWDELTVFEHLELFGTLGGMTYEQIEARGDELLTAVALLDKKYAPSSALSGGMKRKLSAALAFLSEPYMVILDEPSSGMDPFARRGMWDTLKRWRVGHIICLTTHYMDEADALGDRIAIMSNGRLACSGSSTFLKKTFGCGYVLAIAKKGDAVDVDDTIVGLVRKIVGPVAEKMSAVGKELLIQMPFDAADRFPELFQSLDEQKEALKIDAYGTSVTNLEEVFLKVAQVEHAEKRTSSKKYDDIDLAEAAPLTAKEQEPSSMSESIMFFFRQFGALFLRRVKFGYRDPVSFSCNVCIPTFCILFTVIMMTMALTTTLPKLKLWEATDQWNPDVDGPRLPISLGWSAGTTLSFKNEIETRWAQRSKIDSLFKSPINKVVFPTPSGMTQAAVAALVANTALDGLQAEAGFVKYFMANKDRLAASQFGGAFYSNLMGWCPLKNASNTYSWWPTPGVTIFANLTATHAHPILFNWHGEALLSEASAGSITQIKVTNHPLDKTSWERDQLLLVTGILAAVMVMAAFGFIPAGASYYVVYEKEKDVKNQLVISGASLSAYWLSNFVFDVLWGMVPAICTMIIFAIFGMKSFIEEPGIGAAFALFIMFMPAMAGSAYLFSFMFSKAGNALIVCWIFNLATGFLGTILIDILIAIKQTREVGKAFRWVFRFVPVYSLGNGFLTASVNQKQCKNKGVGALSGLHVGGKWCKARDQVDGTYEEEFQCKYMVGDEFLILTLCSFLYIALTFAIDLLYSLPAVKKYLAAQTYRHLPQQTSSLKDEMVTAEEERVNTLDPAAQFVFVKDLHKVYPNRTYAVRGISFAASEGQVFGLLGVNGAGKTSTFKMLCGQVDQTKGEVMIQGISVAKNAPKARQLIGYCPQFDAILETLTVDEHLYLYGRLKGLVGDSLNTTVQSQILELDLAAYVKSRAGKLSGGNKRKLSVAMATIAEPPMVFLDEPSAGMDPVARRGMWSLIQNIADKRQKSVVILTTHSMEEAEALCSRIAIQVDGQFRCLGTPQQIKSRYGQGLELNVRLATPSPNDITAACTKFGGVAGDMVPIEDGRQRIMQAYGEKVTNTLAQRHGSPLMQLPGKSKRMAQLGVLAEWSILQERTTKFEGFLLEELGAESGGRPCCSVLERTQNVIRYQILPEALKGRFASLGALFQLFKDNSSQLLVEDFQLCQTSLEQVFNKFAATQISQDAYAAASAAPAASTSAPPPAARAAPEGEAAPVVMTDVSEDEKEKEKAAATTVGKPSPIEAAEESKPSPIAAPEAPKPSPIAAAEEW